MTATPTSTEPRYGGFSRFELELEVRPLHEAPFPPTNNVPQFAQCLANPAYLNYLAVQKMFDKPDFVAYLGYLQYFKEPKYAKYLQWVLFVSHPGADD
jgi:mediator of RNA polymerase II transcription subunit 31